MRGYFAQQTSAEKKKHPASAMLENEHEAGVMPFWEIQHHNKRLIMCV